MSPSSPPPCGLALIKNQEGLRLSAYLDQGEIPTIGYGHTSSVKMGQTCTEEQASAWLISDTMSAFLALKKLVKVKLSENQAGSLLSFVYNEGIGTFQTSTLLSLLNKGLYEQVPDQLMRYVWFKNKKTGKMEKSEGLKNRRIAEAALWNAKA